MKDRNTLREKIISDGCYSPQENERIYEKWFKNAPRYLFRAADRKYQFTNGTVCDVGCGFGANLSSCAPGSYGLEIDPYCVKFAQSIGLKVQQCDLISDAVAELPQVDAVWNSAVLEHVESPHIFLRKLNLLLKPGGLLVLYAPIIPPLPMLRHLPGLGHYFKGHLHGDHVNAFSPKTLRFFCERAGFSTLEISAFYPGPLSLFNNLVFLVHGCTYIGRKIANWEYPKNSTRRSCSNTKGFEFVGQRPLE